MTICNFQKCKVLHVGKFYPPHMGGMETHLQTLCGELRAHLNLQVIVANDNKQLAEEVLDGVPVSRLPTRFTLASAPICPAMVGKIRHFKADIVHLHLPNPAAILAYLASGSRARLVVTYHSDTVRQRLLGTLFEPCLHQALTRSSAIIATSPDYLRTSPVLSRHRDRCHIIPYGICLEQFQSCPESQVQEVRQRYGERLVVSVGRLVYYKGFEYLIQAMEHVRGKLLIIGSGPLHSKLQQMVTSLKLADKVSLIGEVQNESIARYYQAAEVFVLASIARSEAFGIVQIEAMASGLPVVNTKLDSGVPFVSLNEQTGLTVPPADPIALASALNRILDNRDIRQSFGQAARERARQEFSVTAMISRTLALYSQVTGHSNSEVPKSNFSM